MSPYLTDELRVGDRSSCADRSAATSCGNRPEGGPLQLVGGGSGIVPLMAMIRSRLAAASDVPVRVLLSSRSWDEVIYRDELEDLSRSTTGIEVVHTLSRSQPPAWAGYHRRVDREMLEEVVWPAEDRPLCHVCGPTGLVETVASALVELGHDPARIKTERFGPTGGPQ